MQTNEALIGISSLIIVGILMHTVRSLTSASEEGKKAMSEGFLFSVVFGFYLTLFITVTHELLLACNYLDISALEGFRALIVTLWWMGLACFMIFFGVKRDSFLNEKNLGFTLFVITIFKILIYDLGNVDKNLKVILFIVVGALILGVSYIAQGKESNNKI